MTRCLEVPLLSGALALLASTTADALAAQQPVPDTAFRPVIERPSWAPGTGPRVLIDEGHHNAQNARMLLNAVRWVAGSEIGGH